MKMISIASHSIEAEFKKLFVGLELVFSSLSYILCISLASVIKASVIFTESVCLPQLLVKKNSPGHIEYVDHSQVIGEMKARIISHH